MLRFLLSLLTIALLLCAASPALADKVAVLPFSAAKTSTQPELDQARAWTRDAVIAKGHVPPSAGEMLSAERAVTDGSPDTSQEYRAAGKASGSQWTVTGRIERHDAPPAR